MATNYSTLWEDADKLQKQGADVASAKETAATLPYELKDAFRKTQDPKLDQAINKAGQAALNAPYEGMDKYKNIENPFARRALAEKYQSTFTENWQNLLGEKERRDGVYSDYIEKWTGLFGAEAAKKQDEFNNAKDMFSMKKSLVDSEISRAAKEDTLSNAEMVKKISHLKTQDATWQDINDYLVDQYGADTTSGSFADSQLRKAFGEAPLSKEPDYSAMNTDAKAKTELDNRQKVDDFKKAVKADDKSANYGEYYWKNGKIYKKVNWGRDKEVTPDQVLAGNY